MSQFVSMCSNAIKETKRVREGDFVQQCAYFNDTCFALTKMEEKAQQDVNDGASSSSSSSSSSVSTPSSSSKRKRSSDTLIDKDELQRRIRKFAYMELKSEAFESALKELKRRKQDYGGSSSSSSSSSSSLSALDPKAELEEIMASKNIPESAEELSEEQVKKSKIMREYRRRMNLDGEDYVDEDSAINLDDDGDVDVEELSQMRRKIPNKCPITLLNMKEPVQIETCGHIFSKEGIMNLLVRKSSIPCPQAGCRTTIRKKDVQPIQNESAKRKKMRSQFNQMFLGSQVENYDWDD